MIEAIYLNRVSKQGNMSTLLRKRKSEKECAREREREKQIERDRKREREVSHPNQFNMLSSNFCWFKSQKVVSKLDKKLVKKGGGGKMSTR